MFTRILLLIVFAVSTITSVIISPDIARCDPISLEQIPETLAPWQEWVLYGQDDRQCTPIWQQNGNRRVTNRTTKGDKSTTVTTPRQAPHHCRWPGELTLTLNNSGGSFQQLWQLDQDGWILLPGNAQHWPQRVKLDNEDALVMRSSAAPKTTANNIGRNRPIVWATAGKHIISGYFKWQQLPKNIPIDPNTALISLERNGTFIHQPRLDRNALLWLHKDGATSAANEQDRVNVRVFRRVTDSIPLTLTTNIQLQVSGQERQLHTGVILPDGFVPLALKSPLPARLESDGSLLLQLKPGNWTIELNTRHLGAIDTLLMPTPQQPWAAQEIWSIQSRNKLRIISIEGGTAIDPTQTGMPQRWKKLPAFLMQPDVPLKLVTRKRGNSNPAAEQISIKRTMWLDFDGKGYTIMDSIKGQLSTRSRLEAGPQLDLGRASINNADQLITRLDTKSAAGIEVRQQQINLTAESRLVPENINKIPAVGWQINPNSLHTQLNLPPGWRLLEAIGPDSASSTWVRGWTLLDIFMVLVLALSFAKLWGPLPGIGALCGLILFYHEPQAPRLIWLNVLIPIALLRVLPDGSFQQLTKWYRNIAILALLVTCLVFAVQQIRSAIYPQLSPHMQQYQQHEYRNDVATEAMPRAALMKQMAYDSMAVGSGAQRPQPTIIPQYDPDLKTQTGPGIPNWQWRTIQLRWNGPVTAQQQLELFLLPPVVTRLLLVAGVFLMALMFLRILSPSTLPRWKRTASKTSSTSLMLLAFTATIITMLSVPTTAKADFPPPELLQQLQQRLLEQDSCAPNCVALNQLGINADGQRLRLRITYHSLSDQAVPLPLPAHHLQLQSAQIDQGDAADLYRDPQGRFWAKIPRGRHTLEIYAELPPELQRFQLPIPMAAGVVNISAAKWKISGGQDGAPSRGAIDFTRRTLKNSQQIQPGEIPPFVEVHREIYLGFDWKIKTTVRRLSQTGNAAILPIPLLNNERVTTSGITIKDHQVLVNLSPNSRTFSWESSLEKMSELELLAAPNNHFTEIWQIHADPAWHVTSEGIPVIHYYQHGQWQPRWQPWAGEKLTLHISRPTGTQGQMVTIDSSQLTLKPGKVTSNVELNIQLRSSHGTEHTITLPDQAKLTQVLINSQPQTIKQLNRLVKIPLVPGAQNIILRWQQPQGIDLVTTTPQVHLGATSVDCKLNIQLPHDRWVLFADGPVLGPAVLFWGVLLVIIIMAFILGRFVHSPLRSWQWLLLFAGLSQASLPALIPVAAWLILLVLRKQYVAKLDSPWRFNFAQLTLVALSAIAMLTIVIAIQQGLLGLPEMQVVGNHSSAWNLHWYQDRSSGFIAEAWALTVPMYIYRLLMLLWALWLALALLKWLQWGWDCFSSDGLWRKLPPRQRRERQKHSTQTATKGK